MKSLSVFLSPLVLVQKIYVDGCSSGSRMMVLLYSDPWWSGPWGLSSLERQLTMLSRRLAGVVPPDHLDVHDSLLDRGK